MLKLIADHIVQPFLRHYLKKKRTWNYKGLQLIVYPGVFHPGFFFSSQFLADYIGTLELQGKSFCEPGTGSGLVSLVAYRNGASVTAFDVNPEAVKNTTENFALNFHKDARQSFHTYTSDLFDNIPAQVFDCIAVNPPYFFKPTLNDASKAWNCGQNGEYFSKFFNQLATYSNQETKVYMVLAANCDLQRIQSIADKNNFYFVQVAAKKIRWEMNFIFEIAKRQNNF